MKYYFVVFKKQPGDTEHAYSLVDEQILNTISEYFIHKKKEVPNKLYSKEELEQLRKELL